MDEEKKCADTEKQQKSRTNGGKSGKPYTRKEYKGNKKPTNSEPEQGKKFVNDWKWYALNEQIAKDMASLPFNNIPGVPAEFNLQSGQADAPGTIKKVVDVKALLTLRYYFSPGISTYRTDGVNMAAMQLYSFVRHANSGSKNYESPDLFMYVLALMDAYTTAFEIRRAIGISSYFNYVNRNLPAVIGAGLDVNVDDVIANLANYRSRYNVLISKLNSFAVPSYFTAFQRSALINSNIFADSTSMRGQFYTFLRNGYYLWTPVESTTGTSLKYTSFAHPKSGGSVTYSSLKKLSYYLDVLQQQLDALFLDEDAGIMSGDILKAFRDTELYKLSPIPDGFIVAPVYEETILQQIENSRAISIDALSYGEGNFNIVQTNQIIRFNPTITVSTRPIAVTKVPFNSHKDAPVYTDVLDSSRLVSTVAVSYDQSTQTGTITVTSSGSEIVSEYIVWENNSSASTPMARQYVVSNNNFYPTPTGMEVPYEGVIHMLVFGQFDWHPICVVYAYDSSDLSGDLHIFGDLKVYTFVDQAVFNNMNQNVNCAMYYADDLYSKKR